MTLPSDSDAGPESESDRTSASSCWRAPPQQTADPPFFFFGGGVIILLILSSAPSVPTADESETCATSNHAAADAVCSSPALFQNLLEQQELTQFMTTEQVKSRNESIIGHLTGRYLRRDRPAAVWEESHLASGQTDPTVDGREDDEGHLWLK